jgi:hypothetical protein
MTCLKTFFTRTRQTRKSVKFRTNIITKWKTPENSIRKNSIIRKNVENDWNLQIYYINLFIGNCTSVALQFFTSAPNRSEQMSLNMNITGTLLSASSVEINSWLRLSTIRCVPLCKMTIHPSTDRTHNVTSVIERVRRAQHDSVSYGPSGPACFFKMPPIQLLTVPNVA